MRYLDRSEMRDRLKFLNSMIDMHRKEIQRNDSEYHLGQAKKFQALADEFQAKADSMRARYAEFDTSGTETKINGYLSERAKLTFLMSNRGKTIFKMLDNVPQRYHDQFLTALLSAATHDEPVEIEEVIKSILMQGT